MTGAGGQVGRELVELCERSGDDVIAADHGRLDVVDRDAVLQMVCHRPVPRSSYMQRAWTAATRARATRTARCAVNALGSRHVAEAARRVGAHLVLRVDGLRLRRDEARALRRVGRAEPLSVYGRSKLAGEQEIAVHTAGDATIVRISWVCG